MITKQVLLDALKDQAPEKAREAIFWWTFAWHSGVGSDLYTILCDESLGYTPDPTNNVVDPVSKTTTPRWHSDPDIHVCFNKLDAKFGPMIEYELQPTRLRDVAEGHILVSGSHFHCILDRWPCRVFRSHGALGVRCSEKFHGVDLLPGSEPYFHPLTEVNGYVIGFRR